ncbi:MAG: beta-lactamase family protein [Proteobacteria bacterium]|nr:beta-lactamase family protein [Pseudomonadota bacterium]
MQCWQPAQPVPARSQLQTPEELGFSTARLDYLDRYYADKVQRGELAGMVTLIARHGKIVHFSALGSADIEKRKPMQRDTIVRLYSMTKPITSTALMMLYEEGRFQMKDPISKYLPEFAHLRVLRDPQEAVTDTVPVQREPTIQDLLRHTAGFVHALEMSPLDAEYSRENLFGVDVSLSEMMGRLAKLPLANQPGTRWVYSVGPDVQARLVEVLSGMSFDRFLEQRLFKPLGMKDTGFWVAREKSQRLATVYWMKDGKLAPIDNAHGSPGDAWLSEPWTVNSYTMDHKRKGGSYGLVSTAEDYLRFSQMLLNGGELDGVRILSPRTVAYMARDHLGSIGKLPGMGFGLGFAVMEDPVVAGYPGSVGTYSWAGYASTYFWVDPKEDMVVIAMTQHVDVSVPAAGEIRSQLPALVYSALLN